MSIGGAAVRGLVGPAYYTGEGGRSFGPQVRIDLSSPTFAHIAVGIMTRTWLPWYGGEHVVDRAFGVSLLFR